MINLGKGLYVVRIQFDFWIVKRIQRKEWSVLHLGTSTGTLVEFLRRYLRGIAEYEGTWERFDNSFREVRATLYKRAKAGL